MLRAGLVSAHRVRVARVVLFRVPRPGRAALGACAQGTALGSPRGHLIVQFVISDAVVDQGLAAVAWQRRRRRGRRPRRRAWRNFPAVDAAILVPQVISHTQPRVKRAADDPPRRCWRACEGRFEQMLGFFPPGITHRLLLSAPVAAIE